MLLSSTGRIYESNPVTVINDHCLAKWEETIYVMTINQGRLRLLSMRYHDNNPAPFSIAELNVGRDNEIRY